MQPGLALQTQQILAEESGVTGTVDPLGGSYYLERLTLDMERGCWDYFKRLDEMGGMVAAIEQGFPQREIQLSAYAFQKSVETGEKIIVGVNDFETGDTSPIETLSIDESVAERQPRPASDASGTPRYRPGRGRPSGTFKSGARGCQRHGTHSGMRPRLCDSG